MTYNFFVNVKNLQALQTIILFNHSIPDSHGFIVSMTNTCPDIAKIQ